MKTLINIIGILATVALLLLWASTRTFSDPPVKPEKTSP